MLCYRDASRSAVARVIVGNPPPADFGKIIAEDTEKWAKVIKFAGITPVHGEFINPRTNGHSRSVSDAVLASASLAGITGRFRMFARKIA
jgi:hypothetical protein